MHECYLLISNLPQLVTKDDLMFQDFVQEGEHLENYIIDQDLNDRLLEERISDHLYDELELKWEWETLVELTILCNCHSEFGLDDDGEVRHLGLDCSFNE
jgi:hypothetical protein